MSKKLELLAPAKNKEQGIAAINHGADAVYIGASNFGARVAAGNSIDDIEGLVNYSHLYGSKVFATVNTLLFDNELKKAEELVWDLYNIGVDAIIVQDLGLLELNLPPVELHASTQTHNIDPRRIKFLEQVGFSRVILARETSLNQMKTLRKEIHIDLEAFIQGALCVSYSGQCYMSLYLTGRSGNRGNCAQPCRSTYDLLNENGKILRHNEHLLSLKDFSAAQHIESMIDAGITSFKIEGRLKDISYVKNVTAYYRQLLDNIIYRREGFKASSSGKTIFHFTPDLERTFNRGFTDYFLIDRQKMASMSTQKSIGKPIGKIRSINKNKLTIDTDETLSAGDGICYFSGGVLQGFSINHADGKNIIPNKQLDIEKGTLLWRNSDYAFEKKLQGDTAERKIAVSMTLEETKDGLQLAITDEDGCKANATVPYEKVIVNNAEKAMETTYNQLAKLGGTAFILKSLNQNIERPLFIPSSILNELRRNVINKLEQRRIEYFKPKSKPVETNNIQYFETKLNGLANIVNDKAESFYYRHGVEETERGADQEKNVIDSFFPLMTTKYCIRYELGQCLMHKCNNTIDPDYRGVLYLRNNGKKFQLHFYCNKCEMTITAES